MNQKNSLFQWFARAYVKRRLGRHFEDVRAFGLDHLRDALRERPVILACNHVAWWDPLVLVHLEAVLGADGYCLMDKENLSKLPFFTWLGALPLDRSSSRAAHRDLCKSAELLNVPGRMLVVFPQGEQRPAHLPLVFRTGIAAVSELTSLPVHPVALRYDFQESEKQVIHLSIGPAVQKESTQTRAQYSARLAAEVAFELGRIDAQLLLGDPRAFESLLGREGKTHPALPVGTGALRRLAEKRNKSAEMAGNP